MKRLLSLLLLLTGACRERGPVGELAGAVAVVGPRRLDASTLVRSKVTPAAWVRLELLAQAAEARGLVHEPASSSLVRRLVSQWTAAAAQPPVATAEEIALARTEQWQRFEHGPAVVVHHVVLMKGKRPSPTFDADANALARAFAARVRPDWDFARFSAEAKALPATGGIEVRVEQLPAFVADGRALEGPSGFDPGFARESFTLHAPGESTTPFSTPFGVHVVQLERIEPGVHASDADVRDGLAPELVGRRVQRLQSAAIERNRPTHEVALAPTRESDMELAVRRIVGEPAP